MEEYKHDPLKELSEIRNQLSYSKRIGFLFGAGTSKSMGISDINKLTEKVEDQLKTELTPKFEKIKNEIDEGSKHIESILNHIRLIRQITKDSSAKSFEEISGEDAKNLDVEICDKIYDIISKEESKADTTIARRFVSWLNWLSRDFAKEIFTTNYDLIFEKSAESLRIPFYDGFIGSHEPFFAHESLDGKTTYDKPPISWIRLWKLHGSLGWFWKENEDKKSHRVIRLSSGAKEKYPSAELVIYPSKDKYESSRKQPFISYFDRLKEFLSQGEGIFIISGYSFSDEHVNEIIFNSLHQNNRLHIISFFFEDDPLMKIVTDGKNFPNLTMLSPRKASISGIIGDWEKIKDGDLLSPFWEDGGNYLKLGDFKQLISFLIFCSGMKDVD